MNKGGDAGGVIIGKEDGYILIGDEADETVIGAYSEPTSIALTTSGSHNTVRLKLGAGETTIDWGDGHIEEHDYDYTQSTIHAYADDGDYTITLIGDKTTELHISGSSEAKKADITGVDIGTQYEQVILAMCDLTSLFVPKGVDVKTASDASIASGTDVASVVYENGTTAIGAYDNYAWKTGNYFKDCESLSSVTIPDSIKIIKSDAFDDTPYKTANTSNYCFTAGKVAVTTVNAENKSVVIPNTAKYINPWFSYETGASCVSGVTIGSAVEEIGDYAFYHQYYISSLTLPSALVRIGDNAFFGCSSLTSVTIPASVTSIGKEAFADISRFTEIHFAGSTPPAITGAIADAGVMMIVPVGAKSAYEAAGYTNVYEEGHMPQDISLTWETGAIDPTTGANSTDSNAERSSSTSSLSNVYAEKLVGGYASNYQLMICCYNKSDGTYAGTYNGTSIVQGESWIHGYDDWSSTWDDDLSGLTAYDFVFVIKGKWGSAAGQGQNVVVYGIE